MLNSEPKLELSCKFILLLTAEKFISKEVVRLIGFAIDNLIRQSSGSVSAFELLSGVKEMSINLKFLS
jgi:hypothetical protein